VPPLSIFNSINFFANCAKTGESGTFRRASQNIPTRDYREKEVKMSLDFTFQTHSVHPVFGFFRSRKTSSRIERPRSISKMITRAFSPSPLVQPDRRRVLEVVVQSTIYPVQEEQSKFVQEERLL
jgi:hypothetical protein